MRYFVVACPSCSTLRAVEEGRKTAGCSRCAKTIDLARATPLFKAADIAQAQAFMGAYAAKAAGAAPAFTRDTGGARERARGPRDKARAEIAQAVAGATGRTNQLKLILRRGFESFGEVTPEDLARVVELAGLPWSAAELAQAALDQGLAGRSSSGALIPLREGP